MEKYKIEIRNVQFNPKTLKGQVWFKDFIGEIPFKPYVGMKIKSLNLQTDLIDEEKLRPMMEFYFEVKDIIYDVDKKTFICFAILQTLEAKDISLIKYWGFSIRWYLDMLYTIIFQSKSWKWIVKKYEIIKEWINKRKRKYYFKI